MKLSKFIILIRLREDAFMELMEVEALHMREDEALRNRRVIQRKDTSKTRENPQRFSWPKKLKIFAEIRGCLKI